MTKGGDQMLRRTLLTGMATVTGAAMMPVPAIANNRVIDGLDALLFDPGQQTNQPVALDQLKTLITTAPADFKSVRYGQLARRLPRLLDTAAATRDAAPHDGRGEIEALVAEAYGVATELLIKLHENGMAWATADRAAQAATASGDPHAIAHAHRHAAIVLRRSQHRGQAQQILAATAQRYASATGLTTAREASLYANLLATAAYTAALDDQADTAADLVDEADAALRHGGSAGFGTNDLTLYKVGVSRALGDYGNAVDHARHVHLDLLVTPERRARYWEDTALALYGRGRPADAYHAMRQAEQAAPQGSDSGPGHNSSPRACSPPTYETHSPGCDISLPASASQSDPSAEVFSVTTSSRWPWPSPRGLAATTCGSSTAPVAAALSVILTRDTDPCSWQAARYASVPASGHGHGHRLDPDEQ